ncbi:hypothetical protein Ecaj_0644 [Ehrlichia canis str. Jake]|uniref:Uncharacterized protein n=1 Tax=Ehrlichia canis (strain Jake) TaxID=269484 RepID=A0ACA6AW35_EHRCJ|nr:hypothetical protein Ecaj_0644 [Ehrlichia canis str. Jake]
MHSVQYTHTIIQYNNLHNQIIITNSLQAYTDILKTHTTIHYAYTHNTHISYNTNISLYFEYTCIKKLNNLYSNLCNQIIS